MIFAAAPSLASSTRAVAAYAQLSRASGRLLGDLPGLLLLLDIELLLVAEADGEAAQARASSAAAVCQTVTTTISTGCTINSAAVRSAALDSSDPS